MLLTPLMILRLGHQAIPNRLASGSGNHLVHRIIGLFGRSAGVAFAGTASRLNGIA
jgi:hypothetical protein